MYEFGGLGEEGGGEGEGEDVTMAGQPNNQGKIELLIQWIMEGGDEQLDGTIQHGY